MDSDLSDHFDSSPSERTPSQRGTWPRRGWSPARSPQGTQDSSSQRLHQEDDVQDAGSDMNVTPARLQHNRRQQLPSPLGRSPPYVVRFKEEVMTPEALRSYRPEPSIESNSSRFRWENSSPEETGGTCSPEKRPRIARYEQDKRDRDSPGRARSESNLSSPKSFRPWSIFPDPERGRRVPPEDPPEKADYSPRSPMPFLVSSENEQRYQGPTSSKASHGQFDLLFKQSPARGSSRRPEEREKSPPPKAPFAEVLFDSPVPTEARRGRRYEDIDKDSRPCGSVAFSESFRSMSDSASVGHREDFLWFDKSRDGSPTPRTTGNSSSPKTSRDPDDRIVIDDQGELDRSPSLPSPVHLSSATGSRLKEPFSSDSRRIGPYKQPHGRNGPTAPTVSQASRKAPRNVGAERFEPAVPRHARRAPSTRPQSEERLRTPTPSPVPEIFKTPTTQMRRNHPAKLNETPTRTPGVPVTNRTPQGRTAPKYTKGTGAGSARDHVITAIVQGRGYAKSEVGMASINLVTSKLILCQLTDTHLYSKTVAKLNVFNSVHILMPNTMLDPTAPAELALRIQYVFPSVYIGSVERKLFNENSGVEAVKKLSSTVQNPEFLANAQKYYMLAATGALLKYVESACNVFYAPRSLAIEFQGAEDTVTIDVDTAFRLELVSSTHEGKAGSSLLSTLKYCQIPSGARLLRSNILEPSRDLTLINSRLEAIEELLENPTLFYSLKTILPRFAQLECTISLCCHEPEDLSDVVLERRINCVVFLKQNLEMMTYLQQALEPAKSRIFVELRHELARSDYKDILAIIAKTVHPETVITKDKVAMKMHRCYAIQNGVSSLLDCVRNSHVTIVTEIEDYARGIMEKYSHLPIALAQYASLGYHLQLPKRKKDLSFDIPPEFVSVQKTKNHQSFTTKQLASLNQRVAKLLLQIEILTLRILEELIWSVVNQIRQLYSLSDAISHLDLVVSLAHAAAIGNYQKPEFRNHYLVRESRHPILERSSSDPVVSNDIMLSVSSNFQVISGANMSGKSVFIRQVALVQIMAQVGSFVPASYAALPLVDQVFTRLGSHDSIECSASSFQVELLDMNYIMACATENSLVIVDELCKETAFEEGSSLSWSFAEALLARKCWVLFTTHFTLLTKLADVYFNVTNSHMDVIETTDEEEIPKLRFTFKLKSGNVQIGRYGLKAAAAAGISPDILKEADHSVEEMENALKQKSKGGAQEVEPRLRRDKVDFLVYQRLIFLSSSVGKTPPAELTQGFNELKEFHAKLLQKLADDESTAK